MRRLFPGSRPSISAIMSVQINLPLRNVRLKDVLDVITRSRTGDPLLGGGLWRCLFCWNSAGCRLAASFKDLASLLPFAWIGNDDALWASCAGCDSASAPRRVPTRPARKAAARTIVRVKSILMACP